MSSLPETDVLGRLLERTRLRGRVYCQSARFAPWGLRMDASGEAIFHLVTAGACWLFVGNERRQLTRGDLVLLPRGSAHALGDHPRSKRVNLSDWLAAPRDGGATARTDQARGVETKILCGVYEFEVFGARHPVWGLLPEVVHISSDETREPSEIASTIAALAREYERSARGCSVVVSRLLDVLFVQILRTWSDEQPAGGAGWIGALRDTTLARALSALHQELGASWDVGKLARAAGTSRATLTRRFIAELGEPPLTYLRRARMQDAARRLHQGDEPLASVAQAVGYASEFAFNRAFHQEFGQPPGAYRRQARGTNIRPARRRAGPGASKL